MRLSEIIGELLSLGVSEYEILNGIDLDCNFRDLNEYLENLIEFESVSEAESFRVEISGGDYVVYSGSIPFWVIRVRGGACD